jgi:hypothetical protein
MALGGGSNKSTFDDGKGANKNNLRGCPSSRYRYDTREEDYDDEDDLEEENETYEKDEGIENY